MWRKFNMSGYSSYIQNHEVMLYLKKVFFGESTLDTYTYIDYIKTKICGDYLVISIYLKDPDIEDISLRNSFTYYTLYPYWNIETSIHIDKNITCKDIIKELKLALFAAQADIKKKMQKSEITYRDESRCGYSSLYLQDYSETKDSEMFRYREYLIEKFCKRIDDILENDITKEGNQWIYN